ncbi:hypothetical protein B0A48_06434 [Cryoendolithus antarcticus]|uniref:Major facilitator superfamily (MFS) profile domain-containing protein n=1 Tax=Cryoendolithus antarcticus TaxID=1507870 RepID=A0A1V8TBA7_9PEZI|nr:hypothetical protein B0A48_06434 [Cryoendolithus antarcticus]
MSPTCDIVEQVQQIVTEISEINSSSFSVLDVSSDVKHPTARIRELIVDSPALGVSRDGERFWSQHSKKAYDPDGIVTPPSVFDDPLTAQHLIRKIDLCIMGFACIMFMALQLDQANISRAKTDKFLKDLHLTNNEFNLGNSFWLFGRASFPACRSLLGILQGGFIPDAFLYLLCFHKHHELSLRLSFFWTAMSTADMLADCIAYSLLHMREIEGQAGWRWLFLIEGLFTMCVGILVVFLMPAGPCQTASKFRSKDGWFTPREEDIIGNRVVRKDPTESSMHNRQPIATKLLWKSLKDFDLGPLYIIGLLFQITVTLPAQYLTLSLRGLGFDTFQTNLLAIPHHVSHIVTMLALKYSAEIFGELTLHTMFGQIWAIPFLVFLSVADIAHTNK